MRIRSGVVVVVLLLSCLMFATGLHFDEVSRFQKNELKIRLNFSIPYEEAKNIIQSHYPAFTTDEEIIDFVKTRRIQRLETEDGLFFFSEFEENLFYRDPELRLQHPEWTEKTKPVVVSFLEEYVSETQLTNGFKPRLTPYFKPRTIVVDYAVSVPKSELPDTGFLKLWMPLPLLSPYQNNISILDVQPAEALSGYPVVDGDLAYLVLLFDLERAPDPFEFRYAYAYTRYQQHFDVAVDRIAPYDTESPLYKTYTKSAGGAFYDERFRELALTIVGGETNPYRQAKLFYDYIIDHIDYSFMAHSYYEAVQIPESVVVFENGYGDCGSQSMFFSALCRSIGIPARTTGGFQLFGDQLGSHFWAEFYLPEYGWIPVDTSAGQIALLTSGITEEQRSAFRDYFFGNLDPLRLTVQNDVDLTPAVKPEDVQFLSVVLQLPYVDCEHGNEAFEVSELLLTSVTERVRLIY